MQGDPRLDELINSTETVQQPLRMEHEGLSSPKSREEKSASLSEEVRTIVQTI